MLERPEAANAFDLPAAHAVGAAVEEAGSTALHAVAIVGEGKRFCAGRDVARS